MRQQRALYRHELGVRRVGHPQYSVSGLEVANVATDGAHNAAHILSENRGEIQWKVLLTATRADLPVDRIHARGDRLDKHRIRAERGLRNVELVLQGFRAAIFVYSNSFHRLLRPLPRRIEDKSSHRRPLSGRVA